MMQKKALFKDIKYFLVGDNESGSSNTEMVKQILKDGGALREYYVTQLVDYIISDKSDIPEFNQAKELNIPVVQSNWVHMSAKCETLLPHQPFVLSEPGLFTGLVFCPSQIPTQDRDSLLSMICFHHGKFKTSLSSTCTHLITSKPNGKKYEAAMKNRESIKIVTPEWISDSILAKKLLPEAEYEPITAVLRSPLKPHNNQQVTPHTTPKYIHGTSSSFMTPVTPSQQIEKPSVDVMKEDKENMKTTKIQIPSDLLKGFVILFCDYKERMLADVFSEWQYVIEQASGTIAFTYSNDVTHVLSLHQQHPFCKKAIEDGKLVATAYWLNEVLERRRVFAPFTPLHIPVPFTETIPCMKTMRITVSGYKGRERVRVKHMVEFLGAVYTSDMSKENTHLICKQGGSEKHRKAIEWEMFIVNAKWLGDMIQTGQEFPVKGKTKYGQLGNSNELELNPTFSTRITDIWNQYCFDEKDKERFGKRKKPLEDDGQPSQKQRKTDEISDVKRVLFTGLTGQIVHRLRQSITKMKGELAKSVNDCTHLVAPKITRTVKFLSAVSICKFLVAPKWVDDSFEAKTFLDESNYTLVDPESEELFGFKLKRSLQRAQTRQVCKGLHFHVTPAILPAPVAMKEIIECAGGKMTEVKSVEEVNEKFMYNVVNDSTHNSYLVSCLEDRKLWQDVVKEGYDVYNVELILSGVMKQELEWNLHQLL